MMKWIRSNYKKTPTDWKGNITGKAYTSTSLWHLLHSIRAGSPHKYNIDNPYEFILTLDGFYFGSDKVQICENYPDKGEICANCYSVYEAMKYSVQLNDNE